MATVSIDKDLSPGEKVRFRIELTIFGEEVDSDFKFIVPNAPPLLSKVKGITTKVKNYLEYLTGNNKNYNFSKYKKKENISENRYKLLVVLNSNKVPGDLAPEDDVLINCTEAGFTNVPAVVLPNESSKPNYLYLSVSKTNQPSAAIDTSTTGTVTEIKKKIKKRKITVTIPKSLLKSLVSEKPTTPPQRGNVQDIIVYAYKQFDGPNKSSIKYKLMSNDEEVGLKNPPQRSSVIEYVGKESYSKTFTLNDEKGSKIICYVAVARYVYNGSEWNGEWLQVNRSGDVIWGKAE